MCTEKLSFATICSPCILQLITVHAASAFEKEGLRFCEILNLTDFGECFVLNKYTFLLKREGSAPLHPI